MTRRAPPDGRGRPPHRTRSLCLAAGGREARGVLRRPARRGETSMGKRDVLVRFVIAAAVWLTAAAVLGKEIGGRPGEILVAVAVLVLMAVAWATFTPNARLFGKVVGIGTTPSRWSRSPSTTVPARSGRRACSTRSAIPARGRRSSRSAVRCGRIPTSRGGSSTKVTSSQATATTTRCSSSPGRARSCTSSAPPRARSPTRADGRVTKLFRAPHGFRNPSVSAIAGQEGYRMVGWHGAVFDTARPGVDAIVARCRNVLPARRDPAPARRRRLRPRGRPRPDRRGGAAHRCPRRASAVSSR